MNHTIGDSYVHLDKYPCLWLVYEKCIVKISIEYVKSCENENYFYD